MKTLLLSLVAGFLLSASSPNVANVYICNGPKSTKYHFDDDCRGLNNCSTNVEEVSLKKAQDMGRTLCGFED